MFCVPTRSLEKSSHPLGLALKTHAMGSSRPVFRDSPRAVDPSRSPPVCKLMDYQVDQYRQRMKEKARKGKKQQIKEIQMKVKAERATTSTTSTSMP